MRFLQFPWIHPRSSGYDDTEFGKVCFFYSGTRYHNQGFNIMPWNRGDSMGTFRGQFEDKAYVGIEDRYPKVVR